MISTLLSPAPSTPAFATPRNLTRPTIGPEVAATARLLGRRLVPWQTELVNVAGELDTAGRFAHRYVVVIVPRRAGKTLAMLTYALTVTRRRRSSRGFYASHRRETAAALWRDEWFPALEDSPLYPRHLHLRRSNGSEAMTWRHNRSTFRLLPPRGDAMRTFAADLILIDEAREFTAEQGADFEAAAFPTQTTGLGGQSWIVSSAGTADSTWLARWRDAGRAAAADPSSPICYLEYAAPAGADPDDPSTLAAAHPGIGWHVLTDAIAADRAVMAPDLWCCEYLGWWPETLTDTRFLEAWRAAEALELDLGPAVVLAVELDETRDTATIVAAGAGTDGRLAVELIEHRQHGAWLKPRLEQLVERWAPAAVTYDAGGPAGALALDLAELATAVEPLNTRETAAAAGWLYDRALAGELTHAGDELLDASVRAARRRRVGGGWLFDRRQPGSGPLIAATLAGWVYRGGAGAPPTIT